jgi:HK97 family phage major capsid protein
MSDETITKDDLNEMINESSKTAVKELHEGFQEELKTDIKEVIETAVKTEVGHAASKFVVDPEKKENPSGFLNFTEFAQHVYKAGPGGQGITAKMTEYNTRLKSWGKEAKAAGDPTMVTTDSEAGGYLIPDEFRKTLLKVGIDKTDIMQRTMKIPMQTNAINIPYIKGFDRLTMPEG